ncbi:ATP-binding protein [Streptomyces winkii]|uniref:ATP-binding protein n=1 Tax=Streptomyces winkii TaxID=3051178 RepID=UPI0028D5247A|nr:ATP-binding protein [Streptomyces sp. DSM 40971]
MKHISDVAVWLVPFLAAVAIAAGTVAIRHRREAARNAQRVRVLEKQLRVLEEETLHLVQHRLQAMADAQWRGPRTGVPGPLHDSLAGTDFANAHDSVLEMFSHACESAEQASQSLLLAVARKLQGLANGQQLKINEMTERHDDSAFLEDLMQLDHTNAQILRRAVGMAVVCRAWPGRQHNATSLHDIVRGAIGRILDYKRVHIVRIGDTRAVTGRVVEPLVMTIAELLENATRSSHPRTPVQVHVQLTHSGLAFVIEDAGVGLNAAEQEKATRLLNDDSLGIAKLGDPPRFGLAACGALARRYGFTVSVDTASAFGGVRAVVNLPRTLLTDPVEPPASPAVATAAPRAEADSTEAAPVRGDGEAARPSATTAHGLPKRTRRTAAPSAQNTAERSAAPDAAPRTPSQAAAVIGAFQRAGKAAADRLGPSTEGTPEP